LKPVLQYGDIKLFYLRNNRQCTWK